MEHRSVLLLTKNNNDGSGGCDEDHRGHQWSSAGIGVGAHSLERDI